MARPNLVPCPNCGKKIPDTVTTCLHCKSHVSIREVPQQQMQQVEGATSYMTNASPNNANLIQCPACGNMISKMADACPVCGNPRQKNVANPLVLDALAILAIIIAIGGYAMGNIVLSYGIMLVLLIIYYLYYNTIKDNPDIDASKVKQSLNVITILFIIMFCIGFVIIF